MKNHCINAAAVVAIVPHSVGNRGLTSPHNHTWRGRGDSVMQHGRGL